MNLGALAAGGEYSISKHEAPILAVSWAGHDPADDS